MRSHTRRAIGYVVWFGLLLLLWWALMIIFEQPIWAQTVCVQDPIVPGTVLQDRQPLRAQVEGWVREKGFQTGCPAAWELVVQPLSGTAYSDQTYFVASFSSVPGSIVGTVSTRQPSASFQSWLVTVHRTGRVLEGKQTLGYSLRGGVRKVLRIVSRDAR